MMVWVSSIGFEDSPIKFFTTCAAVFIMNSSAKRFVVMSVSRL
jgi:hypothetical protein